IEPIDRRMVGGGDAGNDSDSQEEELHHRNQLQNHPLRRGNQQVAILLDAPQEPPMAAFQGGGDVAQRHLEAGQTRPSRKRSFFTMVKPSIERIQQRQMCSLLLDATRAVREVREEQRGEYFAEYLFEHMTSENYPNGVGLPHHWGQF
ncbi:hypothetical protein KR009_010661, partial [Drosophila setifemur]